MRPIYHQRPERVEAHIFVAFLAYCLHVTLKAQLRPHAPGLTVRQVLDKFAAMQLLDVHFPTTDGRELIFTRHTEPELRPATAPRPARVDAARAAATPHHGKTRGADVGQTVTQRSVGSSTTYSATHTLQ